MFLQTSFSLDTKAVDVLRHCETVDSSIPVTDEKKEKASSQNKNAGSTFATFFCEKRHRTQPCCYMSENFVLCHDVA